MEGDNVGNERRTRSGRKLSSTLSGSKRKRTEDSSPISDCKMPKTTEAAPAWFTSHLNAAMETNRVNIATDTGAAIEKLSASLNDKIERTNQNFKQHKHDVSEMMKKMQNNIDRCIQ